MPLFIVHLPRQTTNLKSLLSIVLLFSFLIVNMSKSIILIHYEINKDEITKKFCENKDKPLLHCCGKCQLKKKLAAEEEQQKSPAFPDIKTDIQLYCSESLIPFDLSENSGVNILLANSRLQSLFEGTSVFHPPSC